MLRESYYEKGRNLKEGKESFAKTYIEIVLLSCLSLKMMSSSCNECTIEVRAAHD
jgi:hypothetical protein